MGYPGMSADVFQNANISILVCQLFVMLLSVGVATVLNRKANASRAPTALTGAKL